VGVKLSLSILHDARRKDRTTGYGASTVLFVRVKSWDSAIWVWEFRVKDRSITSEYYEKPDNC
jgi:hypothetical protein